MHQCNYIASLPQPPTERTAAAFATVRGQMNYASTNTRPDCTAAVNMLSQIVAHKATAENFQDLDACLARMTAGDLQLKFPALDIDSLEFRVFAESSFANNSDGSS